MQNFVYFAAIAQVDNNNGRVKLDENHHTGFNKKIEIQISINQKLKWDAERTWLGVDRMAMIVQIALQLQQHADRATT